MMKATTTKHTHAQLHRATAMVGGVIKDAVRHKERVPSEDTRYQPLLPDILATWQAEAGISQFQGYPGLQNKVKSSLGNLVGPISIYNVKREEKFWEMAQNVKF